MTGKNLIKTGLGCLLTGVCLFLAFRGLQLEEIKASFGRADYSAVPLYLILLALFFWLKAVRWRMLLLAVKRLGTGSVAPSLMIGFMGNNVLPARLGEIIRVVLLSREFSLSRAAVLSSVILERILDMAAILCVLTVGLVFVDHPPAWISRGSLLLGILTVGTFAGIVVYLKWTHLFIRITRKFISPLPERLSRRIIGLLESAASGFASIQSPVAIFWIVLISMSKWLVMAGMVYLALWSFSIVLPVWASFLVVGVAGLGVMVPSAPGFVGVIQVSFWLSLQLFSVGKADALAASVYYHILQYIPVTLVGLFYLNRKGLSLRRIAKTELETVQLTTKQPRPSP